jgi:hypothetical protein
MAVNRPMSEENIRLLGFEEPPKLLIMAGVYNRVAIALSRKDGAGFQYFAGFPRFRNSHTAARARIFLRTALLAPVQVQQNDFVSQIRVPRNRAAAAILGIARMAAANDYFELAAGAEWLRNRSSDRYCGY